MGVTRQVWSAGQGIAAQGQVKSRLFAILQFKPAAMSTPASAEKLVSLVRELCKLPAETEWLEFKRNRADQEQIGEYISALSNSAALCDRAHGYLLWGVDDATHEIVGTAFDPSAAKVGNEELENWLLRLLHPRINFSFNAVEVDGLHVVVLEVGRAYRHPVQFMHNEFIRIGSLKKKLKEFPECAPATFMHAFDMSSVNT